MNKPAATQCEWGICTRPARAFVTVTRPAATGFDGIQIPAVHREHRMCSAHRIGTKSESLAAGLTFTWRKL